MIKQVIVIISGQFAKCIGSYDIESNKLTVKKGSVIRPSCSPNFKYYTKRLEQINSFCIEKDGNLIVKKDVTFDTPTAAAKFCIGYEVNGTLYWHLEDGRQLKSLLAKK